MSFYTRLAFIRTIEHKFLITISDLRRIYSLLMSGLLLLSKKFGIINLGKRRLRG
jgi:hypothetical protein